jgi:hypothetical protein
LFGAPGITMTSPFYTDPRVVYDGFSHRFFASVLIVDICALPGGNPTCNPGTKTNNSDVLLAVSTDDHPSTWLNWTIYDISSNQTGIIFDQPKLGVNTDKVVMTWNDVGQASTFPEMVIQKSDLVAATNARMTPISDTSHFNVIPVVTIPSEFSGTEAEYAVGVNTATSTATVFTITGTPANNNVNRTATDITVGSFVNQPSTVQPSPGPTIDSGIDAYLSAVWEDNVVWVVGADGCTVTGGTQTRDCVRLERFPVEFTPTLSGEIDLGTNGADLYYPAVAVDVFDNVYIGYSTSSSTQFASAAVSFAPAGPFPAQFPTLGFASGQGVYNNTQTGCTDLSGNCNRWGDYSGAAIDPANPTDVWVGAEYGSTSSTDQSQWGTEIGRFTATAPTVTGFTPNSVPELSLCTTKVTITGTDFLAGATTVYFGTVTSPSVTVFAPDKLVAVAPAEPFGPVQLMAKTPAGEGGPSLPSFGYDADNTPPTASATVTPAPNGAGWNNSGPIVTVTANDFTCGSGIQDITYSATGAQTIATTTVAPTQPTGSFSTSFPITAEGVTTITYEAFDNAGQDSGQQTLVVSLDTSPPQTTASLSGSTSARCGGLLTGTVTVTLAPTDATSGVASTFYEIDGGPLTTYTGPFTVSGVGVHVVTYSSTDVAGNTETTETTTVSIVNPSLCWSIPSSPNSGTNDELIEISCASSSFCVAVGDYYNSSGVDQTLIEAWNGTSWSIVPSPNRGTKGDGLTGVSCVSASSCKAVGSYLDAAGAYQTLVECWNGRTWSIESSLDNSTNNNFLSDVSCVSASSCKAVGVDTPASGPNQTLVESWNGRKWTIMSSPNRGTGDNGLTGVTCRSASSCRTVGTFYATPGAISYHTLVESWNGSTWSVEPSPNPPGTDSELLLVSCPATSFCTAAGDAINPAGQDQTLIENWNGTSWSIVPSPDLGTGDNLLSGVTCVSATSCEAVGDYFVVSSGVWQTLILSWNGTKWSIQPSPNTGTSTNFLYDVACVSATSCFLVGRYSNTGITPYSSLIETYGRP